MKLFVEKKDLLEALKVVSMTVAVTQGDHQSHYLFKLQPDSEDEVEIVSQSGRVFSRVPLKCTFEGDFHPFTTLASKLNQWVVNCSDTTPLEFVYDAEKSETRVSTERTAKRKSAPPFCSVDPDKFFVWHKMVKEAKVSMVLEAERLRDVCEVAKSFIAEDETKVPGFCVMELRQGVFYSTDKQVFVMAHVAGTEKGNLRIQRKDVGTIESFLKLCGDGDVEVLEHDRYAILRRKDGALVGEAKPKNPFPNVETDQVGKGHWWVVSKEELMDNIKFLLPLMDKDEVRVNFRRDGETIVVGMREMEKKELIEVDVPLLDSGELDGVLPIPKKGIGVNVNSLSKLLSKIDDDNVRLEICPREKDGWLRLEYVKGKDTFTSLLMWLG
mgnify:CR=1 FL=1|jgi:hypothetical protein